MGGLDSRRSGPTMLRVNGTPSDRQAPLRFCHGTRHLVQVRGEDAATWLQGVFSGDVRTVGASAVRGLALDRLGRIQADLFALGAADGFGLIVFAGDAKLLLAHLDRLIVMEEVELNLLEGSLWSFHGALPARDAELVASNGQWWSANIRWLTPTDHLVFIPNATSQVAPNWSDVSQKPDHLPECFDSFRIEHGLPILGVDYRHQDNPGVAGLIADAVCQTKGCYLGQEVVCKLIMRGALREQSCRLWFEQSPNVGDEIRSFEDNSPLGTVTSVGKMSDNGVFAIGRIRTTAIETAANVVVGTSLGRILPRKLEEEC